MKHVIYIFCFILTTSSLAQDISTDESVIANGETSFKANCRQCHQVHKKVIGPALASVYENRPYEWILSWIKNSQALINSGDEVAVELFEEYGKAVMPAFPFSNIEIDEILAYIKAETDKGPPVAPSLIVSEEGNSQSEDKVSNTYLIAIIIVLIAVLVLSLITLLYASKTLSKSIKQEYNDEGSPINKPINIGAILKSNTVIGLLVFIFTVLVLKTVIDGAFTIGVQQGYQPTQPIAFSHEIHAGLYEIDCQYCHTGVMKSKSANIPSPNICMNCHTQVKTESEEIKKIYAAVDYDPQTKSYGENTQPIEWIRIHNLPDLAYFNHSQHVNVGDIECQTCHGPVEEMEVVYQYSNLTMGWCINCHRETDVDSKDNAYYTNLVELHEEQGKTSMKVEDIGGLECAKCHY